MRDATPPPLRPGPAKASPPAHANLTPGERAIFGTGLLAALVPHDTGIPHREPVVARRGSAAGRDPRGHLKAARVSPGTGSGGYACPLGEAGRVLTTLSAGCGRSP